MVRVYACGAKMVHVGYLSNFSKEIDRTLLNCSGMTGRKEPQRRLLQVSAVRRADHGRHVLEHER
jgi:hypothetical protein